MNTNWKIKLILFIAIGFVNFSLGQTNAENKNNAELEKLISESKKGNIQSQISLGKYYEIRGKDDKAFEEYKKAADQGDPEAMMLLGKLYDKRGEIEDTEKALEYYIKSAKKNNPDALIFVGLSYESEENYKKAEENYKKAFSILDKEAESGNIQALNSLGWLYWEGIGKEQSDKKGFEYIKKAAEANDSHAQYLLGDKYLQGDDLTGGMPDYKKAIPLLEKATYQGNADAFLSLSNLYRENPNLIKEDNVERILKIYTKAALEGVIYAQIHLYKIYLNGDNPENIFIKKDNKKGMYWLNVAIEEGDIEAKMKFDEISNTKEQMPKSTKDNKSKNSR